MIATKVSNKKKMQEQYCLKKRNMLRLADIQESVSVKNGRWVHEQLQSEIEDEDKFWDEEIEREMKKHDGYGSDEQACWDWNVYQY